VPVTVTSSTGGAAAWAVAAVAIKGLKAAARTIDDALCRNFLVRSIELSPEKIFSPSFQLHNCGLIFSTRQPQT
jgi:hypothetical protein